MTTEAAAPALAEQLAPPSTGNELADEIMALPEHQMSANGDAEDVADAVIADASKSEDGGPEAALADEATTEGAEAAAPATTAPKVDESALFSDDALATKDGVKAAADYLKTKQRDVQTRELVVSKRTSKLRAKVQAFGAEKESFAKEREAQSRLWGEQRQTVQAVLSGDTKTIAAGLARLTGKDQLTFIRELSHLLATDGKNNGNGDVKVKALEDKLAALEKAREEEAIAAQKAMDDRQLEEAMDRIYSVGTNAEKFPTVAALVASSPALKGEVREWLANNVAARYDGVAYRPEHELLAAQELEQMLLAARQPAGTTGAPAAKSDQGQAPKQPSAKPNATAAPKAPAQRKPPGTKMTTEELANDPSFMSALG